MSRGFALAYRFIYSVCFAQTAALQKDGRVLSEKQKAHDDVAQREDDDSPQESCEMQRAWHSWARIARLAIKLGGNLPGRRRSRGLLAQRGGVEVSCSCMFVVGRVPPPIEGSENRSEALRVVEALRSVASRPARDGSPPRKPGGGLVHYGAHGAPSLLQLLISSSLGLLQAWDTTTCSRVHVGHIGNPSASSDKGCVE